VELPKAGISILTDARLDHSKNKTPVLDDAVSVSGVKSKRRRYVLWFQDIMPVLSLINGKLSP